MSASSIDDEVLHVGIHRHMCSVFDEPSKAGIDINRARKISLEPKQLLFDVNTIKKIWNKRITRKSCIVGCSAYELKKESFAPGWNYDFTKIAVDKYPFSRGGHPYTRPLGSMRYGLKVSGKYENDHWLGRQRKRRANGSHDTDWPVAYHGTTDPRAAEIIRSGGFKLEKGVRCKYGRGIYCTPDPKTALAYATPYKCKGHHYKLILQVRVDPARRVVVPKSKHRVAEYDDYWVAKENDAIRPYGICVYRC